MQFPKKVKRDFVMNVEITDNSKEVSGAIHQVGQAMADTGSLLQTWESQQQGRCMEQWPFSIPEGSCGPCGLSANGKVWRNKATGELGCESDLRLRRKSLSHLLPGAGPPIGNYPKRILSLARALRNWYNRGSISARRCMP